MALAREGVHLRYRTRRQEVLESAPTRSVRTGNRPKRSWRRDDEGSRDAILAVCPPPTFSSKCRRAAAGRFPQVRADDWIKALDGNMLAPIALIRRRGRMIGVGSPHCQCHVDAVKAPVAMLALSNGGAYRP